MYHLKLHRDPPVQMYIVRDLFGGAIKAQTNPNLIDASSVTLILQAYAFLYWPSNISDLRIVPDAQEVFMYPDSGVSIIVDILQRVESSTGDGAVR